MSKHYLQAHIGGEIKDFGYRVICEDILACQEEQKYRKGCVFSHLFDRVGMSMINWPVTDIIIGRIEVLGDVKPRLFPTQDPQDAWFVPKEGDDNSE